MGIEKELSRKITFGGLIAALLVVWLHTSNEPSAKGSIGWWAYELIEFGLCPLAVPFFFVVSGFFLGKRTSDVNWYTSAVSKRVSTVLIPFFAWNILFALFCAALNIVANNLAHRDLLYGTVFTSDGAKDFLIRLFWKHPFEGVTWYLRSLFIFVVASPILKMLLQKSKGWILPIFFLLHVIVMPGEVSRTELWVGESLGYLFWGVVSLQGLFYFTLGMHLNEINFSVSRTSSGKLVVIGGGYLFLTVMMVVMHLHGLSLLHFGVCPAPIAIFLGLFFWAGIISKVRISRSVPNVSFPLYLIHQFGICLAGMAIKNISPFEIETFWTCIVRFVMVLIASVPVYLVLRRVPWIWRLLSGGR